MRILDCLGNQFSNLPRGVQVLHLQFEEQEEDAQVVSEVQND
jgi:hypothetical protein